jgi:hypothetical protein
VDCGCSEFPNNHSPDEFTFFKNMLDMLTDIRFAGLEQLHHLCLREPNGVLVKPHFKANRLVWSKSTISFSLFIVNFLKV